MRGATDRIGDVDGDPTTAMLHAPRRPPVSTTVHNGHVFDFPLPAALVSRGRPPRHSRRDRRSPSETMRGRAALTWPEKRPPIRASSVAHPRILSEIKIVASSPAIRGRRGRTADIRTCPARAVDRHSRSRASHTSSNQPDWRRGRRSDDRQSPAPRRTKQPSRPTNAAGRGKSKTWPSLTVVDTGGRRGFQRHRGRF